MSNANNNSGILNKAYLACYALTLFAVFISKGGIIRILGYVNVLFLIYFFSIGGQKLRGWFSLPKVLLLPLAFIMLDVVATHRLSFDNEYREIILVTFFGLTTYFIAKNKLSNFRQALDCSMLLLVIFVIFQLVSIWVLKKPYGTTKNPHYLALYSAYGVVFSVFYYNCTSSINRYVAIPVLIFLVAIVLMTSSRPTWISLFLAAIISLLFFNKKMIAAGFLFLLGITTFLFEFNVGRFGSRMSDLILNITTEERVTIWRDAWTMQKSSTIYEWLFGHGLNVFEENFKKFSTYHLQGNDFTMPHNIFLELLYSSGMIGLGLMCFIYVYIFRLLIKFVIPNEHNKKLGLALLSVLIINLVMGFLTVRWFTHFNSYVIAFELGIIYFIKNKSVNN